MDFSFTHPATPFAYPGDRLAYLRPGNPRFLSCIPFYFFFLFFFFAQDSSIYFAIFSLLIFNKPASGAHCGISATTSSCHPAKSSAYPGFINCPKCLSPLLWRRVLFLGISTASWLSVYSICFSGFGYQAIFTHFLMIIFVIFKFSLEEIQFWTYGWTVITGEDRLLNLL